MRGRSSVRVLPRPEGAGGAAGVDEPTGPEDASGRLGAILERAVARGTISSEQADAILAAEGVRRAGSREDETGSRVRALVAEALGYVGGALALVSALLVVQRFWDEMEVWSRVSLLGVVALVSTAAGGFVRREEEGAVARLGSFLWFAASGAVAAFAAVAATELFGLEEQDVVVAAGSTTAVFSGVLWYLRRSALQEIATFIALLFTAIGSLAMTGPAEEQVGLLVWTFGAAWLLLTFGRAIEPVATGYVLGSVGALLGPFVTAGGGDRWMLLVGLATAGVLIATSIPLRRTVLLGFGTAGLFGYVPRIVFAYFGEALGPPVALFVTGVVLMALALGLARLRPQRWQDRRP